MASNVLSTHVIPTRFSAKVRIIAHSNQIKLSLLCLDIDECSNKLLNTCPSSTSCLNLLGTYRCECNTTNEIDFSNVQKRSSYLAGPSSACSTSCIVDAFERMHAERWPLSGRESCTMCECNEGVVECKPKTCDCNDPDSDGQCCPQCTNTAKVCHHQENSEIVFTNAQKWVYDCQTCQCRVSLFYPLPICVCNLCLCLPRTARSIVGVSVPRSAACLQSKRPATVVRVAKMIRANRRAVSS